jgi:ubiquinone/menaquinone biosynthesis C-methylase UbiE
MIEELVQPPNQFFKENFKDQPLINKYIDDWINILLSPKKVVDLTAGFGIDGQRLSRQQKISTFSMDRSFQVISHLPSNEVPRIVAAAENPPFSESSFSGAILKDSLLFMSDLQRSQCFKNLNKVLVPNGSILVISELVEKFSVHYQAKFPFGSSPQTAYLSTKQELRKYVSEIKSMNFKIMHYVFPVSINSLFVQAEKHGYQFSILEEYDQKEPLAKDNRWSSEPGFIALMTKK